jgi:hypothetical protein
MGAFRECHCDFLLLYIDLSFTSDKMPVYFWSVTAFESAKILSEPAIEGVRNHGHDHIEVDLDQDRRGEGIKMEEFDRLGY